MFGLAGFIAGVILWVQFTRWIGLLYVSVSKQGGDFLGPPKRRLLWAIPFVALLHPAPWLVAAAALFAVRALRSEAEGSGVWFFCGLSIALLLMGLTTALTLARWYASNRSQVRRDDNSPVRTRQR